MDAAPLLELAATALVGRVALSFFPPGWPGGHALRELPATWAASHLLGLALLALQMRALWLVCWLAGWTPRATAAWMLAPWAALGLLRLATLPGAMRPRHEPRRAPAPPAARAAAGLGALLLAAAMLRTGMAPGSSYGLVRAGAGVAAAVLVVATLGQARRAPGARAAALLGLGLAALLAGPPGALAIGLDPPPPPAAACLAAAASTGWLRRADRRAAVLAVLGLAALPLAGLPGVAAGAGGLAGLIGATPAASRARLALFGLPALVAGGLLAGFAGPDGPPVDRLSGVALALLAGLALVLGALALRGARARPEPGRAEPCPRAFAAAGALLVAGTLGELLAGAGAPGAGWLALAPLAALTAGLAAPGERLERAG